MAVLLYLPLLSPIFLPVVSFEIMLEQRKGLVDTVITTVLEDAKQK